MLNQNEQLFTTSALTQFSLENINKPVRERRELPTLLHNPGNLLSAVSSWTVSSMSDIEEAQAIKCTGCRRRDCVDCVKSGSEIADLTKALSAAMEKK